MIKIRQLIHNKTTMSSPIMTTEKNQLNPKKLQTSVTNEKFQFNDFILVVMIVFL